MKSSLAVFAVALVALGATSAFARPDKSLTCPITKEKFTKIDPKLVSVYKGKTFYFCCGGCKPAFDKMSDDKKVALMKYGVDAKKPGTAKPAAPAKGAKKAAN